MPGTKKRGSRASRDKDKKEGGKFKRGGFRRPKVCRCCVDKTDYIDYKDVRVIRERRLCYDDQEVRAGFLPLRSPA